jgi:putative radical SAM enzyme (TIGR03279 family)
MEHKAVIASVDAGSIAEELGLRAGDIVARVNGVPVEDAFDYEFYARDAHIEVTVRKTDGEEILFEIENEAREDLGIRFANMLFGGAKRCANRCVFCFVDQLPKGMRESLYFKDDDARLSFLYGNYVTLTNASGAFLDKIIRRRISPVNVSVHATDGPLRAKMLGNKNAAGLLGALQKLYDARIRMNFQIVLCPEINDGAALDETLETLARFAPQAQSVSVVPVGLTRFREENGLFPLTPFDEAGAKKTLSQIEAWQTRFLKELQTRFVFAADELYLLAARSLPPYADYEDFPQLENGVGMLADARQELSDALENRKGAKAREGKNIIVTGTLAFNFLRESVSRIKRKIENLDLDVLAVENDFFGRSITVSGLICGKDILSQIQSEKAERILIPSNMLKAGEALFLDGVSVADLENSLGARICVCAGMEALVKFCVK